MNTSVVDLPFAAYFRSETQKLADSCLAGTSSLDEWAARRPSYRQQLAEMLGLAPEPERADLHATVAGRFELPEFDVENLHFQSVPDLYVTANLYLPKLRGARAPAILYLCGHSSCVRDGVSLGAKASYQHHGAWLARCGYACLILDTLQLGEIPGIHHGTCREGMWWWNSRGYTPAGVEAWNCVRALDYLQQRPEVDPELLGVTGRSGGGAYSWWVAALDERVKAAVPVAGITDLQNHVVDGCVEGHCDCMYPINTYRWDFAQVAALVAPRPLLIANSDKDDIFPLEGVLRLHEKVRDIYRLYGADDKLGLLITEGPHEDTQDLQLPALRWFDRHLMGVDRRIECAAVRYFQPQTLKVFRELPADSRNATIHETFVPTAPNPPVPDSLESWQVMRDQWMSQLRDRCFAGWPDDEGVPPIHVEVESENEGLRTWHMMIDVQEGVRGQLFIAHHLKQTGPLVARMFVMSGEMWSGFMKRLVYQATERASRAGQSADRGSLRRTPRNPSVGHPPSWLVEVADRELEETLRRFASASGGAAAYFVPRGIEADGKGEANETQIRRRFMLLGQTLAGMQAWDVRCAVRALRAQPGLHDAAVILESSKELAAPTLYGALFEPAVTGAWLANLPVSHRDGPDFLNILRVLDVPQALAMLMERGHVQLEEVDADAWAYPRAVAHALGWDANRLQVEATR